MTWRATNTYGHSCLVSLADVLERVSRGGVWLDDSTVVCGDWTMRKVVEVAS